MSVNCILLLGSNKGNKLQFLHDAIQNISSAIGPIIRESSVWESEPWGYNDNECYLNLALEISTTYEPQTLLAKTQSIENKLGRIRTSTNYEARTIDIDILFINGSIINTENLIVPHPRVQDRKFVLEPLAEITPNKIHPVSGKTIKELLAMCTDTGWVNKF